MMKAAQARLGGAADGRTVLESSGRNSSKHKRKHKHEHKDEAVGGVHLSRRALNGVLLLAAHRLLLTFWRVATRPVFPYNSPLARSAGALS